MATYKVPLTPGTYEDSDITVIGERNGTFNHQVGFRLAGTPTGGTITIRAKGQGSDTFEPIPDGTINLMGLQTLLFHFNATSFQFVIENSGVTSGFILVADATFEES